jgi:hypothetical protein
MQAEPSFLRQPLVQRLQQVQLAQQHQPLVIRRMEIENTSTKAPPRAAPILRDTILQHPELQVRQPGAPVLPVVQVQPEALALRPEVQDQQVAPALQEAPAQPEVLAAQDLQEVLPRALVVAQVRLRIKR